ncbi:Tyrosine recombinase XerC [compost metagenome]
MRKIAETLGIQGNVNTYSARHSFATILLQSEAPLAFISQALGHTSISTTESYLGSFDDEKTKKYLSALL